MNYILLSASILSTVLQNSLSNTVSKSRLKGKYDTFRYNSFLYFISFILFSILALLSGTAVSVYSVLLGLLFGILTMFANFCKLTALSKGFMHITVLVTTSSMIIPTLSGAIFFHERFNFGKVVAMLLLIFFIYISLKKDSNSTISKGWTFNCILAFLFQGLIGIVQKIHQVSVHKDETVVFLAAAFLFSCLFSRVLSGGQNSGFSFTKTEYILAAVCGLCTFAMNYINLELTGLLPTQVLFPLLNGSSIILTSVISIVIFKEQTGLKQIIGIVGGLASLILICVL